MYDRIEAGVTKALTELGAGEASFKVERPSPEFGDFATNAALSAGKLLKQNPKEVAELLKEKLLLQNIDGIEKIEVAGAGFINLSLSPKAVRTEVARAAQDEARGNAVYAGKKVLVEYTDPNPFKEFHIGHLMSNAIGEATARLLESAGATVVRANYQGDVGPHVAKCLFVLLEKNTEHPTIQDLSAAYIEGARRYEENPNDKSAIDQLNKAIYEKTDERVNALYAKGREVSLSHFEELYRILGTRFDRYFFESDMAPIGVALVRAHPEVFETSDGATVFHGEKYDPKLHTRVFLNSLGLPTYEAKELGLTEQKFALENPDLSITVTASEQTDYMRVVTQALTVLHPALAARMKHLTHGMMRFASGKMSSRLGNVVTGESLLMNLTEQAKEKMAARSVAHADKIAEQIAVGAIKYTVLRQGSGKDIIFDAEKSLSLEGDSGPYLQYAHTRAQSLLRAAGDAGIVGSVSDAPSDVALLERTLVHFSAVMDHAVEELEPHFVTTYLTELASNFNSWYAGGKVIGGDHPEYGVLLTRAVANTLARGLFVLGIPVPEEM